ncbi:exonuclease domain-containing protein [Demequina sp.]|uniref:exonuclease domain-containing protein n=1 Tax=Demequina sp. TaxID=2050685 RepID=UPI0025F1B70B|nr:exonuclease domain-containing protein [Demequina sp.]
MPGYAVIDLETTGFAYNSRDRICEVGLVLLDPQGRQEERYTTLVNPQRDLGAQHVHGIDATDARVAPTFDRIVGDLTDLMAGRVVVAHNSAFDTAFLVSEYTRAGWPLDLTPDMTLCTMRMAREFGAPAKLSDCCAHFGIELANAHAALDDAEATATLLTHYMQSSPGSRVWSQWVDFAETIRWPSPPRMATMPVSRGSSAAGSSWLDDVFRTFTIETEIGGGPEYLDLLERVLVDRRISADERRALDGLARSLRLTKPEVEGLHRSYMMMVVDAVCEDDLLTPGERALIIQLARLLDLEDIEVEALLAHATDRVSAISSEVALVSGDLVVLTGMSMARKVELTRLAESRGLVVWPGVKKGVAAVIAQDPGTNSGKAKKARDYGIPVVGEAILTG